MKTFLSIACILFSTSVFAIFCPTNFGSISFGDTIDQVRHICGEPSSQKTYNQAIMGAQEWIYYIKTQPFSQATEKMQVIVNNDKVVNINIPAKEACQIIHIGNTRQTLCKPSGDRMDVDSTTLCGQLIKVKNSAQTVRMACGEPAFTNQQQNAPGPVIEISELSYNGPSGGTLIFENGGLKATK